MKRYRQKGFDLTANQGVYTSREQDGLWSAWVEDHAPSSPCDETLKLHVGNSAFQAQIKAIRSISDKNDGTATCHIANSNADGDIC